MKKEDETTMRILLVEDDRNMSASLKYSLEQEGFLVDACFDGEEALYYCHENLYDLILLDRMLPRLDGLGVLKALRGEGTATPVILLTALGTLNDKVTGLDCGADDYLVKPFAFDELCARIRSIARRPRRLEKTGLLHAADLTFDPDAFSLSGPEGSCSLSPREGCLMEAFLRNPGVPLSRAALLMRVWGPDSDVEEGNLDNYVYFLRRRLRTVGSRVVLRTVRSVGYLLET